MLIRTINQLVLALIIWLLLQIPLVYLFLYRGYFEANLIYGALALAGISIMNYKEWAFLYRNSGGFNFFLFLMAAGALFFSNSLKVGQWNLIRNLILLLALWQWLRFYWLAVVKNPKRTSRSSYLLIFTLVLLFGILEGIFTHFRETHGNQPSLANISWYRAYNGPINEWYLRDNPKPGYLDKKKIVFLGDSFLGGSGIKDIKDRYSDRIEKALGEEYVVFNLAAGGADTRRELQMLRDLRLKPDYVLLCYLGNDINKAAKDFGYSYPLKHPYETLIWPLKQVVKRSYFLNWMYFHLVSSPNAAYADYNQSLYKDKSLLKYHFKDLQRLIGYCRENQIAFSVMIQPFMHNSQDCAYFINPVKEFLREQNIPVLDVSPVFSGVPVKDLVVNPRDLHPNEKANQLIADSLYQFLKGDTLFP